jgi:hypothetical protein
MDKNKSSRLILRSLAGLFAFVILYLILTHFWYPSPRYSIGVNTPFDLRGVTLTLSPHGEFEFGAGGEKTFEDPDWPIPTSIKLTFQDGNTNKYAVEIPTEIKPGFSGQLIVNVVLRTNIYYSSVTLIDSARHGTQTPEVIVPTQK